MKKKSRGKSKKNSKAEKMNQGKNIRYYFLGIVLVILVAGAIVCKLYPSRNLNQKRIEARHNWFAATAMMVNKTGDQEAKQIMDFLLKKSILAYPDKIGDKYGVRVLENAKDPGENWFLLVPLTKADSKLDPQFAFLYQGATFAAMFMPDNRSISLNIDENWSSFGKTIILLHETYHAYQYLNHPYDWKDGQVFAWKEKETHQFQNRLTSELGGERYRNLVNEEAAQIKSRLERDGKYNFSTEYDSRLDEIFGPALSDKERAFRQTSYITQLYFAVLDLQFGKNSERYKAAYLHDLYVKNGIIDPKTDRIVK